MDIISELFGLGPVFFLSGLKWILEAAFLILGIIGMMKYLRK